MPDDSVDLLIVGGGITGAAIARDAAGRGLSVVLAERDDLAANTSSRSTKLCQGGLQDLARGALRRVRTALTERNVLFRNAPHVVRPTRFVIPHDATRRGLTQTTIELWLYDRLGHQAGLARATRVDLRRDPARDLFKAQFKTGFTFTDGICDDVRLVILNAVDAAEHGAEILTRTRVSAARRANGLWYVLLHRGGGTATRALRARALINAAGPWSSEFQSDVLETPTTTRSRFMRGGHLLVPALGQETSVYVLMRPPQRPIYVVPYQGFALVGPVERADETNASADDIGDEEVRELLDTLGHYFVRPPTARDVAFTYAGVWTAARGGGELRHEAEIELDQGPDRAPLVNLRGGSLVLHRRIAERVLARLQPLLGFPAGPWTEHAALPGGDFGGLAFDEFLTNLQVSRSWLPVALAERWAKTYGTRSDQILGRAQSLRDLGEEIGEGLFEAEIDYLRRVELATTDEDILWRRTKLGLQASGATERRLQSKLGTRRRAAA